jgi:hypothetical protein
MREGLIPTALGAVVTGVGATMRAMDMRRRGMSKHEIMPLIGAGILGFGLAHVVLGTIDLVQHRR